jgi:hypothetical protein
VFPPYVDDVVGEGGAGWAVIVKTGYAAVDIERGRIEVFVLWLPPLVLCVTVRKNGPAYLHELLEGSPLKGLALVGSRVTRHRDLLALWDLVAEVWCGGSEVLLGGMW